MKYLHYLLATVTIGAIQFGSLPTAEAQTANSAVTVNCSAYTRRPSGTTVGAWTSGYCGALVTFRNFSTNHTIKRYVACSLSVETAISTCSVSKTHGQLGVPNGYSAVSEYAPDLPNKYLSSGAWYAYADNPLKGVLSSTHNGNTYRTITLEHELISHN